MEQVMGIEAASSAVNRTSGKKIALRGPA